MKKFIFVLQYLWLGVAIFALVTGVVYIVKGQAKDALAFFVITGIGGFLFKINKDRHKKYFTDDNSAQQ